VQQTEAQRASGAEQGLAEASGAIASPVIRHSSPALAGQTRQTQTVEDTRVCSCCKRLLFFILLSLLAIFKFKHNKHHQQ
jgi:hypothetical protein